MIDLGLLLVRFIVGGLLAAHGLRKLTSWFGGPGLEGNREFLASLGYRRPRFFAWIHGLAETAAGLLLVTGMLLPVAAAAVIAVMLNAAVAVHRANGLWVQQGGYEYPLVLAVVTAGLALTGPGAVAVDAAVGWDLTGWWAVAGIAAGLVLGALALTIRQRPTLEEIAPIEEPARDRVPA